MFLRGELMCCPEFLVIKTRMYFVWLGLWRAAYGEQSQRQLLQMEVMLLPSPSLVAERLRRQGIAHLDGRHTGASSSRHQTSHVL
jgi:hypothetical protein